VHQPTFLKFLIVGGSGVVVNLGAFSALVALGLNKFIASPIAIEVSIVSNFILNNYWTFRHRETGTSLRVRGLKFNVVSVVALALSYATFVVLSLRFPTLPAQISQLAGIVPATLANYALNALWTFKDVEGDAPTPPRPV
jgi:dolichol-phosphate mannosyltransferase